MDKKLLIIVYGLPGCGKTIVCETLKKETKNLTYINLGGDNKFKEEPLVDIAKRLFNYDTNVIIEGCFPHINFRRSLAKEFKNTHNTICVYCYETLERLSKRRNRNVYDYWQLTKQMQVLYMPPSDIIMDLKEINERVEFIKKILNE